MFAMVLALGAFVTMSAGASQVAAQPSPTAIIQRIRSTGNRPIDFHAAAFPDTVYVGQQVTYQVAVLLSEEARGRLRRNPEFLPPELRGLLAYELGAPTRVPSRAYGGPRSYEAHVFQRALFGVTAGPLRVPSPQLTYSLPQSASYFSREERFTVRAESAQLIIKPLPVEGRPTDFTGAVGVLRASTRLSAFEARVGDPMVLTVRIEGTGNVRLFPRPPLEVSWATVVPGNERLQMDTSGALVRGAKEFDFLLTPTRDGAVTLPVIRYVYFDPYRSLYAVAETQPADVRVAAGELAATGSEDQAEQLALRAWRRSSTATLSELSPSVRNATGAFVLLLPVPALVALVARARRRRSSDRAATTVTPPREPTVHDASPAGQARRARRTVLAVLAERLQVAPTDLVAPGDVERVLRRRGVTRATTAALVVLLDDLARVGFGPASITAGDITPLEHRARQLLDAVHAEAVTHGRTPLWRRRASRRGTLALCLALPFGALVRPSAVRAQSTMATGTPAVVACTTAVDPTVANVNAAPAAPRSVPTPLDLLVGEGTAAYAARRYAAATQRLAVAAAACPRDVDLLVNWGTAAWAANDTVSAVMAWQRAARLDPLAADVQARMALLPAGARGGLAAIPMIPVVPLAVLAVVAWGLAWLLLFASWRSVQRRSALEASALVLIVGAIAAGAAAWRGAQALDGTGLAIIRRPETLRSAPGFEAATVGGVSTGDVVRMSTVQEGWSRVMLADGRDGWLPASRLAPLVADTPIR